MKQPVCTGGVCREGRRGVEWHLKQENQMMWLSLTCFHYLFSIPNPEFNMIKGHKLARSIRLIWDRQFISQLMKLTSDTYGRTFVFVSSLFERQSECSGNNLYSAWNNSPLLFIYIYIYNPIFGFCAAVLYLISSSVLWGLRSLPEIVLMSYYG